MKKTLTIIATLLFALSTYAQKVVENNIMSINVPDGWKVEEINAAGAQCVTFYNTGDVVYNIGLIVGIEVFLDPQAMITAQIKDESSVVFKGATIGEFYPTTFMGKKAYSANFENTINGVFYKGAIYAFNEGEKTIGCIGAYMPGHKSRLPEIWRSIKWKEGKMSNSAGMSLEEETRNFINTFGPLWKKNPPTADGEQLLSMRFEEDGKPCVVYIKKILNTSKSAIPEENMEAVTKKIKANLIPSMKGNINTSKLFSRWVEAGYDFKYEYYDMNDELFFIIPISSEDLR